MNKENQWDMQTKMELFTLKTKAMKNRLLYCFLLFVPYLYAQDSSFGPFDFHGDRSDIEKFYLLEVEFLPGTINPTNTLVDDEYGTTYKAPLNGSCQTYVRISNKVLRSESSFKNGLLEGTKYIYNKDGGLFQEIPFTKGKMNGVYKIYDYRGNLILETTYKNNIKHGIRKYYLKSNRDGDYIEGNYTNGVLDPTVKIVNRYSTSIYPNDLSRGVVKAYVEAQLRYEIPIYKYKGIHGKAIDYGSNGLKLQTQEFYYGKSHGLYERYNNKGELLYSCRYKFGKPIGVHKTYSDGGQLLSENYYDEEGNKIGTWKKYDTKGNLTEEASYANDSLDGESKTYYKGKLGTLALYKNGLITSRKNYSDKSGQVLADYFYENGVCIYVDEFNEKGIRLTQLGYTKGVASSKKYFDKKGNLIWENFFKSGSIRLGTYKEFTINENDDVVLSRVSEYNKDGQQLVSTSYTPNGDWVETHYKNYQWHGARISYNKENDTKTVVYYFNNKIVTEEEFNSLSK